MPGEFRSFDEILKTSFGLAVGWNISPIGPRGIGPTASGGA